MTSLSRKLPSPLGHFGLLMRLRKEAKNKNKRVTVLGGVSDPDYHREMRLSPHSTGKEEHTCNTGDALGAPTVITPVPVRSTGNHNGPVQAGVKVWVTSAG